MKGYLTKIFRWYFSRRALPYWCVLGLDTAIVFVSSLLVFALNHGVIYTLSNFWSVCATLGLYLACFIVGFRIFHTYAGVLRFSSFIDLKRVSDGVLLGMALCVLIRWGFDLNERMMPVRLRDLLMWSVAATLLMWLLRVFVKFLYDSLYQRRGAESVFIYGVRRGGVALAKSIRNQDPASWRVAAFITDDPKMNGHMLMGVPVYPNDERLTERMNACGASALFVSPLCADHLRNNQAMINALLDANIKIFLTPQEQEWDGHSPLNAGQLREIDIEDLLPREKIEIDLEAIGDMLKGASVLITGAAGSIGSEIASQTAMFGPGKLVLIDQAETPLHDIRLMMRRDFSEVNAVTIVADIVDRKRMAQIFELYKPEYVFHAAAYKHVPMMEDNPGESIRNNVEGTRVLADLSLAQGVRRFVMVSTDKAVNPTNVMGASKRICEIYVQSLDKAVKEGRMKGHTRFVTTRFGNVLGSNGSVIPLFKDQIRRGAPLTVTHPDIIRYFMLIPEACKLVLEAGTMGEGGEIFVFDMGEPVKIVDLARRMIKLSGSDLPIVFTGLRDGEKLYEEVLNEKETTLATDHPKIMRAKVREYDYPTANAQIDALVSLSHNGADDMEVVKMMKDIVPEYVSQHSIYERLDVKHDLKPSADSSSTLAASAAAAATSPALG